jgi:hypothetical protein
MEFTVRRSQWFRGNGHEFSRLKRHDGGKMCCLGFYALACGIPEQAITEIAFPSVIEYGWDTDARIRMSWLWEARSDSTGLEMELTIGQVNDEESLSDKEREADLTKLFAFNDITVTFVD